MPHEKKQNASASSSLAARQLPVSVWRDPLNDVAVARFSDWLDAELAKLEDRFADFVTNRAITADRNTRSSASP